MIVIAIAQHHGRGLIVISVTVLGPGPSIHVPIPNTSQPISQPPHVHVLIVVPFLSAIMGPRWLMRHPMMAAIANVIQIGLRVRMAYVPFVHQSQHVQKAKSMPMLVSIQLFVVHVSHHHVMRQPWIVEMGPGSKLPQTNANVNVPRHGKVPQPIHVQSVHWVLKRSKQPLQRLVVMLN